MVKRVDIRITNKLTTAKRPISITPTLVAPVKMPVGTFTSPLSVSDTSSRLAEFDIHIDGAFYRYGLFTQPMDAAVNVEIVRLTFDKLPFDTFTQAERISKAASKAVNEIKTTVESLSKAASKAVQEISTISEVVSLSAAFVVVLSDLALTMDSFAYSHSIDPSAYPDTTTYQERLVKAVGRTLADTTGGVDYLSFISNSFIDKFDISSVSEVVSKGSFKPVDDFTTTVDSLIISRGFGVEVYDLALTMDSFNFVEAVDPGSYPDVTTALELFSKLISKPFTDSVSKAETDFKGVGKNIVELKSAVESALAVLQAYFAEDYTAEDYIGLSITLI